MQTDNSTASAQADGADRAPAGSGETAAEHIRNALQILRTLCADQERAHFFIYEDLETFAAIDRRLVSALNQHTQAARDAESMANWMADVAEAVGLDRSGEWHYSDVVKAAAYAQGRAIAGTELAASLRPMGAR